MLRSFTVGVFLALSLNALAIAAPPSYTVIDLGVHQSGEGLPWQGIAGHPAQGGFPVPSGGSGTIYASNNVATVGTVTRPGYETDAALWTVNSAGNVVLTNLGIPLGGAGTGEPPFAAAYGANRAGDVVGISDAPYTVANPTSTQSVQHAFLWSNGTVKDLSTIAGLDYFSEAEGVNDSRDIVGWTNTISSVTGGVLQRAFIYVEGTMYNLTFYLVGGPTVLLSDATAINCQGNISAMGTPAADSSGIVHDYLLVREGAQRVCTH